MAPQLTTRHLSKSFGTLKAVDDICLDFAPGKIHAILGENGAGKSTLMRLLFGLHAPTSGEIQLDSKPIRFSGAQAAIASGLGMVQQHFTLVETLSVIDNIMLGAEVCGSLGQLDRAAAIERVEALLPSQNLAVPWHQLVHTLSVGQKQRVEILKWLFREARILFLDEPTAVLAPAEIEDFFAVLRRLRDEGRTVLLITHKIGEVLRLCDTYAILRAGRLVDQGEVAASSADKMVAAMIGRSLPEFKVERPQVAAHTVLEVRDLSEPGVERGRLQGVSFQLRAGEIFGIAGVEGSGQASLVSALMGLNDFHGDIHVLGQAVRPHETAKVRALGVGLIPEDRLLQGLWLEESCTINMIVGLENHFVRHQILQFSEIERATGRWAKDFDVRANSLATKVANLSGGNQQKVIFAREVHGRKPKLLICHQPTRGVDLGAIDLLHRELMQLRAEGLAILLLSSELDELLKLSDRIGVLFAGRMTAEFARADFLVARIGRAMAGVVDV